VLKKFREAMGGASAYPALDDLEKELVERRNRRKADGLPRIQTSLPKGSLRPS
jgi:hypothetical protein